MYNKRLPLTPRPELLERGSDLAQMVQAAANAADKHIPGSPGLINKARTLLHSSCPQYRRSQADGHGLLCASGERDGQPVRSECIGCNVGSFSANGMFVGEILPAGADFSL